MRRALRIALVGSLTLAMCFDSATACHFFRGRWGGHDGCGPSYCHGPTNYAGPCRGVTITSDGCYGEVVGYEGEYVDGCCGNGVVIEGEQTRAGDVPAPIPPERQPAETFRPMEAETAPALEDDSMPAERPLPPPGDEDALFAPSEPAPLDTIPAETPPATTPVEEPATDIFTPPADTPAEAPAETPPAETEPAADLFGTEEDAATDTSTPAETPTTESTETPPAEDPAADPSGAELFGDAPEGETTETPAGETPADEPPAEDGAAPEEGAAPATEESEEGDIFEFDSTMREPGGLKSGELRTWVDNTGQYSTNGRLVRFLDGKVRLLKENGRTTTVPLYRLSQSDLEFVHRQASAQQAEVIGQTVLANTMLPVLAN